MRAPAIVNRGLFTRLLAALSLGALTAASTAAAMDEPPSDPKETPAPTAPATEPAPPPPAAPPVIVAPERTALHAPSDWLDTSDPPPGKRQYWLGLRYHGLVVPKFVMNIFTDGGRTAYTNTAGIEFEIRHDRFSIIPNVTYADYGMGDTLFLEKGKDATEPANYSYVHSTLKAIYAGVDILWSAKLHRTVDFEYGLGLGIGVLWGDLIQNWVYLSPTAGANDPNYPLVDDAGRRYDKCQTNDTYHGCNVMDHVNATTPKTGGYVLPGWFDGGSRPSLFARLNVPILGLRIHPLRDLEFRTQIGLSLTEGFFYGVGLSYRLPTK